jgi:hypothetical protein
MQMVNHCVGPVGARMIDCLGRRNKASTGVELHPATRWLSSETASQSGRSWCPASSCRPSCRCLWVRSRRGCIDRHRIRTGLHGARGRYLVAGGEGGAQGTR